MKITATPVDAFQVEIDGTPVGTFRIDSEWNGLTCLKTENGNKIIAALDAPILFESLFNGKGAKTGHVATASPSVLALLPAPLQDEDDGSEM